MSFIGFSVPGTIYPLFFLCFFQLKTSFCLLGQWICQLYCSYIGLNSSSSCFSLLVCGFYFPLCFHFLLPRDRAFFTRLAPCSKKSILFRNSGRYVWESWSHHEFFYLSRSRHSLASREDSTFQVTCFPNQDSGATARLLNRLDLDPSGTTSKSLTMATRTLFGSRFQNACIALPGRVEPFNRASYVVVASSSFPDREA